MSLLHASVVQLTVTSSSSSAAAAAAAVAVAVTDRQQSHRLYRLQDSIPQVLLDTPSAVCRR